MKWGHGEHCHALNCNVAFGMCVPIDTSMGVIWCTQVSVPDIQVACCTLAAKNMHFSAWQQAIENTNAGAYQRHAVNITAIGHHAMGQESGKT